MFFFSLLLRQRLSENPASGFLSPTSGLCLAGLRAETPAVLSGLNLHKMAMTVDV